MREMDLIPADYREQQVMRKCLMAFLAAMLTLILCVILGRIAIGVKTQNANSEITRLNENSASLREYQQEIDALNKEQMQLNHELAFVEMLNEGGQARLVFQILDQALDDQIVLMAWAYEAQDLIDRESSEAAALNEPISGLHARIIARGEAGKHAALTGFVERLSENEQVHEVRVVQSAMADPALGTVRFELEIL